MEVIYHVMEVIYHVMEVIYHVMEVTYYVMEVAYPMMEVTYPMMRMYLATTFYQNVLDMTIHVHVKCNEGPPTFKGNRG